MGHIQAKVPSLCNQWLPFAEHLVNPVLYFGTESGETVHGDMFTKSKSEKQQTIGNYKNGLESVLE